MTDTRLETLLWDLEAATARAIEQIDDEHTEGDHAERVRETLNDFLIELRTCIAVALDPRTPRKVTRTNSGNVQPMTIIKGDNMEISIDKLLQCQSLLTTRYLEDQEAKIKQVGMSPRVLHVHDSDEVVYRLTKADPLPEGMKAGEAIYGRMQTLWTATLKRYVVPIYVGTIANTN